MNPVQKNNIIVILTYFWEQIAIRRWTLNKSMERRPAFPRKVNATIQIQLEYVSAELGI